MAKRPLSIGLDRTERAQWRFPWWIVAAIVLVILGAVLAYLFQFQIRRAITPKPTAPPPPPGASGGQAFAPGVLYQTKFDDPASAKDWETFDDGTISAKIKDGTLVVGVNAVTDTGTWSGLNFTFEDFELDVDATKVAGPDDNGIIVIFHLTDRQNYDRFDISSDGYYALSKVRAGVPTIISNFPVNPLPAIKAGNQTNHIRAIGRASVFSFEVNGTPVKLCIAADASSKPVWDQKGNCLGGTLTDSWRDTDFTKGKIGLGAQGFVPHTNAQSPQPAIATIAFNNVVIKSPDTP